MLAHVELIKTDHYQYGESWTLSIGDIEHPDKPKFSTKISEWEAGQAIKSFSNCEKFGRFNENEKWT